MENKIVRAFSLSKENLDWLDSQPCLNRSEFVDRAIKAARKTSFAVPTVNAISEVKTP